jgi:hypothetical protein
VSLCCHTSFGCDTLVLRSFAPLAGHSMRQVQKQQMRKQVRCSSNSAAAAVQQQQQRRSAAYNHCCAAAATAAAASRGSVVVLLRSKHHMSSQQTFRLRLARSNRQGGLAVKLAPTGLSKGQYEPILTPNAKISAPLAWRQTGSCRSTRCWDHKTNHHL